MTDTPRCTACGTPLVRRPSENAPNFRARKTCSAECRDKRSAVGGRQARKRAIENGSIQAPVKRDRRIRFPGATTVEQFLAMGGTVTVAPPAYCAPVISGSPPYGLNIKASSW